MRVDPSEADEGIDPFGLPDDGLTEEEMVVRDLLGPVPAVERALAVVDRVAAIAEDADINF